MSIKDTVINLNMDDGCTYKMYYDTSCCINIIPQLFAELIFEPQEDITAYELARIINCGVTPNINYIFGREQNIRLSFYTVDKYNDFIEKHNDLLKHFNIKVYGNVKEQK